MRSALGPTRKTFSRATDPDWKLDPPPCHPDRSVAERRDLRFNGPLLEMIRGRVEFPVRSF
jgi:hypothetical protein